MLSLRARCSVSQAVLAEAGLEPWQSFATVWVRLFPFPTSYFDVVYSSNVLEHVNEPPKVIGEIIRVLKPGGHAQIVVPNYGSWWEGHYGIDLAPPSSGRSRQAIRSAARPGAKLH